MKIRASTGNQGIAIIMALIAIFVLSVLAADFALSMKVETRLAANANNEDQLIWLGRSGVEYARWVLGQQAAIAAEQFDSLNQKWAGGSGTIAESNSVLASISLDNIQVGEGQFSVKIVDCERKLNINTADELVIKQALNQMQVDASLAAIISDSILDWIDPDESPRLAGAESDYYQTLTPPYYAKDAPIDDLTELLLVKGISAHTNIYFGGCDELANASGASHHLGFGNAPNQGTCYPFGLKDVFTSVSSGLLNVNTADANTLSCLPGMDLDSARQIIKKRAGPDGVDGNDDDTPFHSPAEIVQAVNPQVGGQIARYCTTRSSTFEVTVTAVDGPFTRKYHAILMRISPTDIRTVGFYWE